MNYPGCSPDRACVHGNPWGGDCPYCDGYNNPTIPSEKEKEMKDNSVELGKLSIKELAVRYNMMANLIGLPNVTKFSDKRTGVKRVMEMERSQSLQAHLASTGQTLEEAIAPKAPPVPDVANLIPDEPKAEADRKVNIPDAEIKVPELTSKKDLDAVKVPRVTKASIIRNLFENSGLEGVHRDTLSEASGHDLKNVGICMQILANADRTKDPIKFVKIGKVYFRPEYAPEA